MVKVFRALSFIEGLSFLALLLIAMPLKYIWQMPIYTKVVGTVHGGLFLIFLVVLFQTAMSRRWSLKKALGLFLTSSIPFGFVIVERMAKREQL